MAIAYNTKIVTDELVLCLDAANKKSYPGTGTTWTDLSGNGNNGTLVNGPTFNSENGGSIVFNGTNNYSSFIDSSSLRLLGSFTLSAWINCNSPLSSYQMIFDSQTSTGLYGYTLRLDNSTGRILFRISNSSSSIEKQGNLSLTANLWYNVVGVYNGTSISIYLNSVLDASLSGSITPAYITPLRIGSRVDGYFFNGKISQAQIYNRALSTAEIQQNFNAFRGRYGL